MKKFVVKLCLVGGALFLILLSLELYLLSVPNEYTYKRKYVEAHLDDISVLLLGSSHVRNGLNPDVMGDSVFNMATDSRGRYYDMRIVERYVPRMKNLRCVVWEMGYNFQYTSQRYHCTHRKIQKNLMGNTIPCMHDKYMGIAGQGKPRGWYWSEIMHSNYDFLHHPSLSPEAQRDCTPLGFGHRQPRSDETDTHWQQGNLPFIVEREGGIADKARAEAIDQIARMAEVCRENGVRFVVFSTPCHASFHAEMTDEGRADYARFAAEVQVRCPNVEWYDYTEEPRVSADNLFSDSSHLNTPGANIFSRIFCAEVLGR